MCIRDRGAAELPRVVLDGFHDRKFRVAFPLCLQFSSDEAEEAGLAGAPGAEERNVDWHLDVRGEVANNARDLCVSELVAVFVFEGGIEDEVRLGQRGRRRLLRPRFARPVYNLIVRHAWPFSCLYAPTVSPTGTTKSGRMTADRR